MFKEILARWDSDMTLPRWDSEHLSRTSGERRVALDRAWEAVEQPEAMSFGRTEDSIFSLYSGRSHGFLKPWGTCEPPFIRLNPFSGSLVPSSEIQRSSAAFASSSVPHVSRTTCEKASFPYFLMAFAKWERPFDFAA